MNNPGQDVIIIGTGAGAVAWKRMGQKYSMPPLRLDCGWSERSVPRVGVRGPLQALAGLHDGDLVNLRSPLDPESRCVLFRSAAAVLANSGHEPFGLVGLETMAAVGVACTGCSGEDYAMADENALVQQTSDPQEFVGLFGALRGNPTGERTLRHDGQRTDRRFAWSHIVQQILLPRLHLLSPGALATPAHGGPLQTCAAQPVLSTTLPMAQRSILQRVTGAFS